MNVRDRGDWKNKFDVEKGTAEEMEEGAFY